MADALIATLCSLQQSLCGAVSMLGDVTRYQQSQTCYVGHRCLRPQGHRAPVADMAVDASGGLLASGGADRAVRVWDADGGYCTHVFSGHTCVAAMRAQKRLWRCSSVCASRAQLGI